MLFSQDGIVVYLAQPKPEKPMKYLKIECPKYLRKVKISEIHCIISQDGQLTLEMTNGEKLLHCAPLKLLEKELPETFIKINRNVIINTASAISIQKVSKTVTLSHGREFVISRRQMPLITKTFSKFLDEVNSQSD